MKADPQLAGYYARRAREYERIYAKPERQEDLQQLRQRVAAFATGARVLELACGTGWWTEVLASAAVSVTAVDVNSAVLELARNKRLPNVKFRQDDLYALPQLEGPFDAGFAAFWWSHVPRAQISEFLRGFHQQLQPNARVMFLDNRFVPGSSTPVSRTDVEGNTWQCRRLEDGSEIEVLKNFPAFDELTATLTEFATDVQVELLPYYWCLTYRLPDRLTP
jgi:demethylmenaquinone methyltransferase/2-methoxy-6-polyprenyl-1,4-benzoquinol methylase